MMIKITQDEFKVFAEYVRQISGLCLDQRKAYLIETRLKNLMREQDCDSYMALYRKARADTGKSLENKIIEAIVTHETLFFRDAWPFDLLHEKLLPDIVAMREAESPLPIRIWSAGCATGQEIYSIAMMLRETLSDLRKYAITLLGTDISATAIAQAESGTYHRFETDRGLSSIRLRRFFVPMGNNWQIRDDLRAMTTFKTHHLMQPLRGSGVFDIVFCRNVAIYFDAEGQKRLFDNLATVMARGGRLITGSTESVVNVCSRFKPERHQRAFFYQLR